jgi:hypothetical protein
MDGSMDYNTTLYNSDQIGITTLLLIAYASKQLQMVCTSPTPAKTVPLLCSPNLQRENETKQD